MLLGSEEGPYSESKGGAEGLSAWEAVFFSGSIQANAFCPTEGAPFVHKDLGTFCVNTGRTNVLVLLGAAKGSAPLNGKLVTASFLYLQLEILVFFRISEAQKGASGPAGSP